MGRACGGCHSRCILVEVVFVSEREHEKGSELVADTHEDVKGVDICQLQKGVNILLRMSESITAGDCITALSARIHSFLEKHKLSRAFPPSGVIGKRPGEGYISVYPNGAGPPLRVYLQQKTESSTIARRKVATIQMMNPLEDRVSNN